LTIKLAHREALSMAQDGYFTAASLRFLAELRLHNDRGWFLKNKDRFERTVRDPMLHFIGDIGPVLRRIDPGFVADPRPVGGSMMRIYRDTRFARDKSPYKTFAAAHFRHAQGTDGRSPGYYLRMSRDIRWSGRGSGGRIHPP
jgi:uncharacterized protein (TIGR02453 family)